MASPIRFRPTSCEDAAAISELYHDAYRPVNGGDARDFYPYPQLLLPEGVKDMMRSGVRWFVAELGGAVIGTCGAVLSVGAPEDKIAEAFGLVIREDYRFCGYARRLFNYLDDFLVRREETLFTIAEARTAHSGGWKVVRRSGFIALGFEPAAHRTPAGHESMLLAGKVSCRALELRKRPAVSSIDVSNVALAVLNQLESGSLSVEIENIGESRGIKPQISYRDQKYDINIIEHIYDQQRIRDVRNALSVYRSSVVSLKRMRGKLARSDRFDRKLLVASRGERSVGYAQLDIDVRDQRVKIDGLIGYDHGVLGSLLLRVFDMTKARIGDVFSVVIETRSDDIGLHHLLEGMGFLVTAYYPAFIFEDGYRVDCVQFTFLHNVNLTEACRAADLREWPAASKIKSEICKANVHES
jgi:GNAT superfamily N-acetyltransferase